MMQDDDHEMADPFLQLFELLFNSQRVLTRSFSLIFLQPPKGDNKFNEPRILE